MERLQAALEIARKKRQANQTATDAEPAFRSDEPVQQGGRDGGSSGWRDMATFLPDPRLLNENRIVTLKSDSGYPSFDMLQTKVLLQMAKNNWTRLAITSPTVGCGKTTVVSNLAIGFLRQTDKRVIVLEMDMRRPMMSSILGIEADDSVADVLEDRTPLGHQAVRLGTNVALSVNPGPVRNPANLFMKEKTAQVLDRIEEEYAPDLMIFDMPPMLVSDDATAFLKNVDCALIVAGSGKSTVWHVDSCEKEIAQYTNVLGTVLNMSDSSETTYGEPYGATAAQEAV